MDQTVILLSRGRYCARLTNRAEDIVAAQTLRTLCFERPEAAGDAFDAICEHVMIEDVQSGELVSSFRLLKLASGAEIAGSYAAQYYDLHALQSYSGRMLEMGRFCIHPERSDPDILRLAWGALTAFVDRADVAMLFGCSSFAGTLPQPYLAAFALLRLRHAAPDCWLPRPKAAEVLRFDTLDGGAIDAKSANQQLPPLLRTYLLMGGWVSDHAVVDREMNTLHVFTGLEIGAVPVARQRLLRAVVGEVCAASGGI